MVGPEAHHCYVNTTPLIVKSFNTPSEYELPLVAPLYEVTSFQNCQVNTTPLTFQTSLITFPQ